MTRTPRRFALAALLSSFVLGACLSVDDIEVRHDSCADGTGDADPMIGKWQHTGGKGQCEIFSNHRFSGGCGLVGHNEFGAYDWDRLNDGRYYFSYTNSFGEVIGECVASVTFKADCDQVTLSDKCGNGEPFSLSLTRVK